MSAPLDATSCADLAVQMKLIDNQTARECLYELDDPKGTPNQLIQLLERRGLITPLQSSKLLRGDLDGYYLGGYRLLYKIASGSFGRVYRGDDPSTGQVVAVKVLRRRWTEDKHRIESFEREGRLGMSLQHPNIVQILAVGHDESSGQYYIVMEFVEGGNLRDILQIRKKLDVNEALRILDESTAGLVYAYSRGLTHRDIKASNILLSIDRTAKLVDFGLAGVTEGAAVLFTSSKPGEKEDKEAGDRTVDYAGLERNTGVKAGDVRSDIYFLGHVLFEIITGEPLMPYTRDKNARMLRRRFEDAEELLLKKAVEFEIPPVVQRLIAKAIAFDPSRRYQTPTEFHEAIKIARQELEGGSSQAYDGRRAGGPLTIFACEANQNLQNVFREQFRKVGFERVLISSDETQPYKRYQTQPFHAVLFDAGTVGPSALDELRRLVREAERTSRDLAVVMIVNEDQSAIQAQLKALPNVRTYQRPVTMKQLNEYLREAIPELSAAKKS